METSRVSPPTSAKCVLRKFLRLSPTKTQSLTFSFECRYPNLTIWITEYAYNDATLPDTQSFFNSSAEYFDRIDYITRYSYFGSFRSSQSNVGPNVSMLDKNGKLTDIGSWYLGGAETNNIPTDSAVAVTAGSVWWALFVVGICFCVL
jgi:hypothetical protein